MENSPCEHRGRPADQEIHPYSRTRKSIIVMALDSYFPCSEPDENSPHTNTLYL
jgi:hypothetical protein